MALKKLNPVTSGSRHRIVDDYSDITTNIPEESLLRPVRKTGGRNNLGRRTMRYIGGGHKQMYRVIDFKRNKNGIAAEVKSIEYDPNRSARIALVQYADGEKRYIIAPDHLKVGQKVMSGENAPPDLGNALMLKDIPPGTFVHNIELYPGQGGTIARSAGTSAQLMAKEGKFATLRMPSGEMRMVMSNCMATIGSVSNPDNMNLMFGKAGAIRHYGRRPRNRGVAMNPVDHPMGGGEGKASGGHPRSRKGIKAKGFKTRNPKKHTSKFILRRRK